ncbi:hypothetical protein WJX73_004613 [Symbiochloris irregularis]|uniref:Cytochrome P450 n=1 Tax=Symbiochloris irregularis TaxID=706552 RepID=A0AAW1P2Q7_9CHLO
MAPLGRATSFGEAKGAGLVGGRSHTDPFFTTAVAAVVGLPLVGFLGLSASHILEPAASRRLAPALWILLAAVFAWCSFPVITKLVKIARRVRARSQALQSLPGPEYGLLGVLNIINQRPDLHRLVTEWVEKFGPLVRVRFLLFHAVIVTDPVLATHITRSKIMDKFRFLYHRLDPFLGGPNLLTGPSDAHWRLVRKGISPAFSAGRMRDACGTVVQYALKLTDILLAAGPDAEQDVDNLLLRESMDVIGKFGFNKDMNALDGVASGIDTTGHTGTWTLYLISQHPEVEAKIVAELDALELLATTERPSPRPLVSADLGKLPYLSCVIKEVLRMYPPVAFGQMRVSFQHDLTLAGRLTIPRGTLLWVPHHSLQNATFNWDDADKFLPERWMQRGTEYADLSKLRLDPEWYEGLGIDMTSPGRDGDIPNEENARPKRYFPFAEGPRDCVGQNLARVSLLATTATLLSRLSFRLCPKMNGPEGVRASEQYTLVTGLKHGMSMHAIPRVPSTAGGVNSYMWVGQGRSGVFAEPVCSQVPCQF